VVFFNYTTMQVTAKIVYYGPGLCGKTTNLQYIHHKTDPGSRGEMVSLETEADRTLFFDLLPLEVGVIGGMRVRLQLYTVPGQVFYNTTRKLVLKGVDGIVFVADSQVPALDANVESLNNLLQNLGELNQPLDSIPFLFQYNKRDLKNIHGVETLNESLNFKGYEVYEAAALHGVGVFETLKAISRKTLAAVRKRIDGGGARREVALPAPGQPESVISTFTAPAAASPSPPSDEPLAGLVPVAGPPGEDARWSEAKSPPSAAKPSPAQAPAAALARGTEEVRVEFAASPDATPTSIRVEPAGPAGKVRKIATLSTLDIERELEKLRRLARGGGGRDKPRPVENEPPGQEVQEIKVKLPRAALDSAKELAIDLRLLGGESVYSLPEVSRLHLPARSKGKLQVQLSFEVDSEDRSG
jgi:hypothetical protein